MKIKLQKLTVTNFKGLPHFELNLGGDSAIIAGKNGAGKTTLADAYYWLFSDQDSIGQTNFDIIELDKSGHPIDNQDAVVEADIFVGSSAHNLKKVYRQKWTKKRGQLEAELTGHTTEYFFNGAPVSKTKYTDKLKGILSGDMFRILSDVHYFCAKTKPDDRRRVLMDITGGISDHNIMRQHNSLLTLPALMRSLSVDEFRAALLLERRKINDQLKEIPARIDELKQMMPDLKDVDEIKLRDELQIIEKKISEKKHEIIALESGLKINELKAKSAELREQRAAISSDDLIAHSQKLTTIGTAITGLEAQILESKKECDELSKRKSHLAEKWKQINRKKLSDTEKCHFCGQALPAEFETDFNLRKAEEIKEIDGQAADIIQRIDAHELKIRRHKLDIVELQAAFEAEKDEIDKINIEIEAKKAQVSKEITETESKINALMVDIAPEITALESSLSELEIEKNKIESTLLDFTQQIKIIKRIDVKKEEIKKSADAFETVEKRLNMLEEFSMIKSKMIEDNANAHFQITTWRLFEKQINGGVKEVCEPMRDGVPYSSTLNTGSRINVGLDCIRTISDFYDLHCPIFVDDAEKITEWQEIEGAQVIKLIAMPNVDKIEVINEN